MTPANVLNGHICLSESFLFGLERGHNCWLLVVDLWLDIVDW
jgi:hypothetical protein